jgi:hypothetical protein
MVATFLPVIARGSAARLGRLEVAVAMGAGTSVMSILSARARLADAMGRGAEAGDTLSRSAAPADLPSVPVYSRGP